MGGQEDANPASPEGRAKNTLERKLGYVLLDNIGGVILFSQKH
jgi:hypothetical protein